MPTGAKQAISTSKTVTKRREDARDGSALVAEKALRFDLVLELNRQPPVNSPQEQPVTPRRPEGYFRFATFPGNVLSAPFGRGSVTEAAPLG